MYHFSSNHFAPTKVNVLKFRTLISFCSSNKMLVFRARIYKFLVRVANREDPVRLLLQKQSDLGLPYLFRPFWQVASFRNFRAFTVHVFSLGYGNTMPNLSNLVPFHSGQVENFYLLVLGQVQMYKVNTILYFIF